MIGTLKLDTFELSSQDTYSDKAVFESVKQTGKISELCACAIQTSIVGFGNKSFGKFIFKGTEMDVVDIYNECGVKHNLQLNAKLAPDTLTPRRLQRLFRVQIYEFLSKNKDIMPYLWKKYSSHEEKYRAWTFPGSESLITEKDVAISLIQTYLFLDTRLGTDISSRIIRVLSTRGIVSPSDAITNCLLLSLGNSLLPLLSNGSSTIPAPLPPSPPRLLSRNRRPPRIRLPSRTPALLRRSRQLKNPRYRKEKQRNSRCSKETSPSKR